MYTIREILEEPNKSKHFKFVGAHQIYGNELLNHHIISVKHIKNILEDTFTDVLCNENYMRKILEYDSRDS